MQHMHSFRLRMMYESYLSLNTMGIIGMILFFNFFMDFDTIYPWIFLAVYALYTLIIATSYIYKVHVLSLEDLEPNLWLTLMDGIFLCFFLYFSKQYFGVLSHLFYIYLVLISILFSQKKSLYFSSFVSLCYVVLVTLLDVKDLFSFNAVINILLIFLLGYVLSSLITEINKLESRMGYICEDLENKNLLLNEMICKDFLTNLYNHKTFYLYYKQFIQRSCDHKESFSVAMLDIDNFKKVNDTYGHLAGDLILREVSSLILANIQQNDIAARYGGEEFAIIFPDPIPKKSIETCEKIRTAIETHPFDVDGQVIKVTISGGVAGGIFKKPHHKQSKLLEFVDQLMYKAKMAGKNKILFSQELLVISD
ncbi:MAG: diguanylate cyclase [Clostridia bacterium]|nr:diguanylate cyclase [Clostridia bacterium]